MNYDELNLCFKNYVFNYPENLATFSKKDNEEIKATRVGCMVKADSNIRLSYEEIFDENGISKFFLVHLLETDGTDVNLEVGDNDFKNEHVLRTVSLMGMRDSGLVITAADIIKGDLIYRETKTAITIGEGKEDGNLLVNEKATKVSLEDVIASIVDLNVERFIEGFPPQKVHE